jgi:hypothetical protein
MIVTIHITDYAKERSNSAKLAAGRRNRLALPTQPQRCSIPETAVKNTRTRRVQIAPSCAKLGPILRSAGPAGELIFPHPGD